MKVIIDKNKCIGCGTCQALCPEHFKLGDDSKARLEPAADNGTSDKEELEITEVGCCQQAADGCPTESIVVEK